MKLLIALLITTSAFAQDSLFLVDGSIHRGKIEKITNDRVSIIENYVSKEINARLVKSVYKDGKDIGFVPDAIPAHHGAKGQG
ncbi:MAG TPA: hypothetical protein PKW06_11350 [Cyclobacteriaceae bacterium]|nr:hypothetical protein [Cyclobacteriaceae bacterium]MCB9237211.1 hypothetical protein [Flammeovirgaceae bacterium]MCB0499971.1 hypothetical protein [Cyclobacteriaceae bacterium]MCO5270921.1 hypothetical protein [Cyclobacteriaceae bacterium]MCW5901793.1 hypothetical protein [Cyclobacteriaceae bacterium]